MAARRINLLIVEDEQQLARLWSNELAHKADITAVHTLEDARRRMRAAPFDVVFLDLRLPDGDGLDLLREINERNEDTAVVILTGNADLDSAIGAVRYGAYDYLRKPSSLVEMEQVLDRIIQQMRLRDENEALRRQLLSHGISDALVGSSPAMENVRRLIARVAPTNTVVLVTGETGTGKEVASRLIHSQSMRKDGPFVPVNCAAMPRELAESELFGHRKGAFTSADRDHRGLILAATGGTLFLDEIGDLALDLQAKFLRVLESGEARRVGDDEPYRTDARIIAATNRDLRAETAAGRFRQDLYYRLSAFEIHMPALREIPEDIAPIAVHLLAAVNVPGARARRFSEAALTALRSYSWPGNVRELRNVVERAKILCDGEEIMPQHLNLPAACGARVAEHVVPSTIAEMERVMIERAMRMHGGNKRAAAAALGISLRTLYNRLKTMPSAARAAL